MPLAMVATGASSRRRASRGQESRPWSTSKGSKVSTLRNLTGNHQPPQSRSPHDGKMTAVAPTAERVGDGARILVVDDEPNITDLLSTALRYTGFSVAVAATGRQALAQASTFLP